MAPEAADASLFDGEFAIDARLRLAVIDRPWPEAVDDAEGLLRDIAGIEERRGDDLDAAPPSDPALRRVEAKLDLLLRLVAEALPATAGLPLQPVRMGPRGLRLAAQPGLPDRATLRWQPGEGLPLAVSLPLRRVASDARQDWWRFEQVPESLADALSRHLFRLHRRALAATRRGA